MSDLRLRLTSIDDSDVAPPVYRFPTEEVRGWGDPDAGDSHSASTDALEMAHQIEQALDVLQDRLDDVKEELDGAYRFPDPDDWRPSAA